MRDQIIDVTEGAGRGIRRVDSVAEGIDHAWVWKGLRNTADVASLRAVKLYELEAGSLSHTARREFSPPIPRKT